MPRLKILNSKDIVQILESFGFEVAGQKGSHIKLSRKTPIQKQVLTIPNNKNLPARLWWKAIDWEKQIEQELNHLSYTVWSPTAKNIASFFDIYKKTTLVL